VSVPMLQAMPCRACLPPLSPARSHLC
jgi:hypothetical protein